MPKRDEYVCLASRTSLRKRGTFAVWPYAINLLHLRMDFGTTLPYSDKRKQLLKMTFLVNEHNVSVMYIYINVLSCFDLNIFQQDECFCSKLGLEVEHAKSNSKTSISKIWVICHLFSFCQSRAAQIMPFRVQFRDALMSVGTTLVCEWHWPLTPTLPHTNASHMLFDDA